MNRAPPSEQTVAILMDFENARDASLQRVLAEAAAFGRVIVRRAYADWTRHAKAQNALREAGFEELHQFTTGSGTKNATDIHLAVDAMDLLYTRPIDVYMLVTADSDFAKLARRLREGGKRVIGMGSRKRVGRALVQSCDQFIYYDQPPATPSLESLPEATYAMESRAASTKARSEAPQEKVSDVKLGEKHRIVLEAMPAATDAEGRVYGGPLHESIRRIRPDFSYRDFGFSTFIRFMESLAPVVRARRDPEASDFVVWVDSAYEDILPRNVADLPTEEPERDIELDEEIQRHIDARWDELMGNRKRLAGSRAAEIVAEEYGVERLADTPLKDLQGVLDASPLLAKRWRRERASLVPR